MAERAACERHDEQLWREQSARWSEVTAADDEPHGWRAPRQPRDARRLPGLSWWRRLVLAVTRWRASFSKGRR